MSGTKQCDSILLFFCPTECERFISPHKDSSNFVVFFFILKLMKILWKSSVFYLFPSYALDTHTISKSWNIYLIDSNFFKAVTRKQRIFILNDKQEQQINY